MAPNDFSCATTESPEWIDMGWFYESDRYSTFNRIPCQPIRRYPPKEYTYFHPVEKPKRLDPLYVARKFRHALSEVEKAFLHNANMPKTLRGVHERALSHRRNKRALALFIPEPVVHKKLPCWRSGRWKSLT
jgi:hypothetical protein